MRAPCFSASAAKAERIVERMDVQRLCEMHALKIMPAAQHLAHLIGRPRLDIGAEIDAQHRDMLDQPGFIVGAAHREAPVARLHARHRGLGDRAADVLDAGLGERPQLLRARQPDAFRDRIDPLGKSRRHEPAVAAGRAARDLAGFEHGDRPAAPRHLARDRQPGKPGADDANIHVEIVGQGRTLRRLHHRRRVPGLGTGLGHLSLMPRLPGFSQAARGGILVPRTRSSHTTRGKYACELRVQKGH